MIVDSCDNETRRRQIPLKLRVASQYDLRTQFWLICRPRKCENEPMPKVTIYHNPRCSKSRQTLALLRDNDVEPTIVEYLKTPPDEKTLAGLLKKLGMKPQELIRKKEYRALGLPDTDDSAELIARMAANPQIIERPIVVCGKNARLGRPPESVLEIL